MSQSLLSRNFVVGVKVDDEGPDRGHYVRMPFIRSDWYAPGSKVCYKTREVGRGLVRHWQAAALAQQVVGTMVIARALRARRQA